MLKVFSDHKQEEGKKADAPTPFFPSSPVQLTVEYDLDLAGDRRRAVGVGGLAGEPGAEVLPPERPVHHPVAHGATTGHLVGGVHQGATPPPSQLGGGGTCSQQRLGISHPTGLLNLQE